MAGLIRILVVGTADTKGEELAYLADRIAAAGAMPVLVDVGIGAAKTSTIIANTEIAACHPDGMVFLGKGDRGIAVTAMGQSLRRGLERRKDFDAIIGIGGGGGTSIITEGMQALPIGLPKLMVSTMASGNVSPYVGVTDITMMYSVTDFAGLNRLSRVILANAAWGIAGMAQARAQVTQAKPAVGLTMFGVTTPCVSAVAAQLKDSFDCMVFHATGTGGRAMEKLVDSGMITGLIDVTTTEICDHLCGGVLSAGPDRLGAVARTGIAYVGSAGALDLVNFQDPETVPQRYAGRLFHRHNPQVTLMRTTPAECAGIGRFIAEKLNACSGPVRFLIPEGGVSMLDAPGQPFFDPEADAALFDAIEAGLRQTSDRKLVRLPFHINAPEFAAALVQQFLAITPARSHHAGA